MGLFDAYDADATDIPATSTGIPEGVWDGIISGAAYRDDVYNQSKGDKFFCIDVSVQGYDWPRSLNLILPVGSAKTWSTEGVFETNTRTGATYTESQVMTRRLQRIRDVLAGLGIPPEQQNAIEPQDLLGLEVVGTFKANAKGYVNLTKVEVKKNDLTVVEAKSDAEALSNLGW